MNYILFGEQYPMLKKRLNRLLSERLGEVNDLNVARYNCIEDDILQAISDCYYLPLGVERKAVVIDNVNFLGKTGNKEIINGFTELFRNPTDEVDIFLIVRGAEVNQKLEIFELAKAKGQVIECSNLKKEDWPTYIRKFFSDRDVEIDSDAVVELNSRIDGDLSRLINECTKLSIYTSHVTLIDVTTMVAKPIEDDIFKLSNALLRGDKATALDIYRDLQLIGPKATDTLIPMLGNQFRFMSQCLYLNSHGFDKYQIAAQLGVSDRRVTANLLSARSCKLKTDEVSKVLDNLYQLDAKIKSGRIDRFYGFELFLINFPN